MSDVKFGSIVRAKYCYLADGSKLRVRDAGSNGFDYLGSLTYTSNSLGLQLESAAFGDGVIRVTGTSQEINYFLTDHLGSVRVIVDKNGAVKERNDYYAFGAKHIRGDYPQSDNRYDYNGKEEQTTGDLKFLDYGARMYDGALGRWFCVDPLAEERLDVTPFAFCSNIPISRIDPNGMLDDEIYSIDGTWLFSDNKTTDYIIIRQRNELNIFLNTQPWLKEKLPEYTDTKLMDMTISPKAYSKIFTRILSKMEGVDTEKLKNNAVSVRIMNDDDWTFNSKNTYNDPSALFANAVTSDRSKITAVIRPGEYREYYGTVSNVQNMLGDHEFKGHITYGWGDSNGAHHKVYEYQMRQRSWNTTTPFFKQMVIDNYKYYLPK